MRIILDQSKCDGLGMCEAEAPDLFEVQDDGSLVVLDLTPADDRRDEVEAACDACPTRALSIADAS
ncbi:ferredoxin [Pseudonocardia sp. Cha107L01]|uniref:ferredoxin n=1 Tax=Pseudonocardia sp. Cha107L01 TaxID=3457576 RepID=UPI00403EC6D9